jgi:hypothetical protein
MAVRRSGVSGWYEPMSCRWQSRWVMNAVLVTVAFLPQWSAAMDARICDKSGYLMMVYYRPNCATTTSHATITRQSPIADILAAANAVILGKSRKPASPSAACSPGAIC